MVALFGQLAIDRLKESSLTLFNRPLEEDNPCQVTADVVGMIKACHDSSVRFFKGAGFLFFINFFFLIVCFSLGRAEGFFFLAM
jgi:hypothetical protein